MLDLRPIDQRRPEPGVQPGFHPHPSAECGTQQIADATHDLVQIDAHRFQRLFARERHQLTHQRGAALGRLQDHRKTARVRGIIAQLVMQHLRIAADRDQQVVEVVRNTGGQPANPAMVCA